METALYARIDMGLSLAFHIIFASIGITMPLLMVTAEWRWLKTQNPVYLALAKHWSKGTAVFFAIGAVSGTVLSFELGLLFPHFMEKAGAVIGLPFALEGFAFFTEAIFLGIYLYGWDKVSPRLHLLGGVVVAVSGLLSAAFVTLANSWMNVPTGTTPGVSDLRGVDPLNVFRSPAALHEIPHSIAASLVAASLAVAGIHAFICLRNRESEFHRKALQLALAVAVPLSLLQPLIGHFAGQRVVHYQPLKFAAMEGQFTTENGAPLRLGGIIDYPNRTHHLSIEIPKLLSFLATDDFNGKVPGFDQFPTTDWPSPIVHYCFQIMVGLGTLLALYALLTSVFVLRKKPIWQSRHFLKATIAMAPLGILAMQAGWMVTEIGRQPWVIYNVMRTHEATVPLPGILISLTAFALIYVTLGIMSVVILWRHIRRSPDFYAS